jgi:hypothetical protein
MSTTPPPLISDRQASSASRRLHKSGKTRLHEALVGRDDALRLAWAKHPSAPWHVADRFGRLPLLDAMLFYGQRLFFTKRFAKISAPDKPVQLGVLELCQSEEPKLEEAFDNEQLLEVARQVLIAAIAGTAIKDLSPHDQETLLHALPQEPAHRAAMVSSLQKAGMSFNYFMSLGQPCTMAMWAVLNLRSFAEISWWLARDRNPDPLTTVIPSRLNYGSLESPGLLSAILTSWDKLAEQDDPARTKTMELVDQALERGARLTRQSFYDAPPAYDKSSIAHSPKPSPPKNLWELAQGTGHATLIARFSSHPETTDSDRLRMFIVALEKASTVSACAQEGLSDLHALLAALPDKTTVPAQWNSKRDFILDKVLCLLLPSVSSAKFPEITSLLPRLRSLGVDTSAWRPRSSEHFRNILRNSLSYLRAPEALALFGVGGPYQSKGAVENSPGRLLVELVHLFLFTSMPASSFLIRPKALALLEGLVSQLPQDSISEPERLELQAHLFSQIPSSALPWPLLEHVLTLLERVGFKPDNCAVYSILHRWTDGSNGDKVYSDQASVCLALADWAIARTPQTEVLSWVVPKTRQPEQDDAGLPDLRGYADCANWSEELALDTHFTIMTKVGLKLQDCNQLPRADGNQIYSPLSVACRLMRSPSPAMHAHQARLIRWLLEHGADPLKELPVGDAPAGIWVQGLAPDHPYRAERINMHQRELELKVDAVQQVPRRRL